MQGCLNETCVGPKARFGSCMVVKKNQNRAGVLLAMSEDLSLEMLGCGTDDGETQSCYPCYFSKIIRSAVLLFVLGLLLIV